MEDNNVKEKSIFFIKKKKRQKWLKYQRKRRKYG